MLSSSVLCAAQAEDASAAAGHAAAATRRAEMEQSLQAALAQSADAGHYHSSPESFMQVHVLLLDDSLQGK